MLSDRAKYYLKSLARRAVPTDRSEVGDILHSRDLPVPEAILAFQESFGGYEFHAGLEPLIATILFPRADFLRDQPWTVPHASKEADQFFFQCFDTLYQFDFHLDSNGTYYENWEPVHASFACLIEGKALLAEMSQSGGWERVTDAHESFSDLTAYPVIGLRRDNVASCRFTSWWYNDVTVVERCEGHIVAWKRTASGK